MPFIIIHYICDIYGRLYYVLGSCKELNHFIIDQNNLSCYLVSEKVKNKTTQHDHSVM